MRKYSKFTGMPQFPSDDSTCAFLSSCHVLGCLPCEPWWFGEFWRPVLSSFGFLWCIVRIWLRVLALGEEPVRGTISPNSADFSVLVKVIHAVFSAGKVSSTPQGTGCNRKLMKFESRYVAGTKNWIQGTGSLSLSFLFLLLAQAPTSPLILPLWLHLSVWRHTSLNKLLCLHFKRSWLQNGSPGPRLHVLMVAWNLPPLHCFWDRPCWSPRHKAYDGLSWVGSTLVLYFRLKAGRSQELASLLTSSIWWASS